MALKTGLFACTLSLANCYGNKSPRFYQSSRDEADYTLPAENMLLHGSYLRNPADPWSGVYRMPGYSLTYLPLRAALGPEAGKTALVLLQVALGALAVYGTARLALGVSESRLVFLSAFLLFGLSITTSVFDSYILPDGLATSILVFCVWSLFRSSGRSPIPWLLLSGALFTYAFFLRPFLLPLLAVFLGFTWSVRPRGRWQAMALLVAAPLLGEVAWMARNYALLGTAVPLQTAGLVQSGPERAVRDWITSFGGDYVHWRTGTVAAWLRQEPRFAPALPPLPEAILRSPCGLARIEEGARLYRAYARDPDPRVGERVQSIFSDCRRAYVETNPFDHHVMARLRLLRAFLVHAGPVLPIPRFAELPLFSAAAVFKVLEAGLHVLILVTGIPGLLMLALRRTPPAAVVTAIPTFIFTFFPLVFRFVETRYFAEAWPFLCIGSAVVVANGLARVGHWVGWARSLEGPTERDGPLVR